MLYDHLFQIPNKYRLETIFNIIVQTKFNFGTCTYVLDYKSKQMKIFLCTQTSLSNNYSTSWSIASKQEHQKEGGGQRGEEIIKGKQQAYHEPDPIKFKSIIHHRSQSPTCTQISLQNDKVLIH